jgi:hypothetical protein
MTGLDELRKAIARLITARLSQPLRDGATCIPSDPDMMKRVLRPCDVVLVEGNQRISTAIKYLTQSTWSHAAIYVGDALAPGSDRVLVEADLNDGVIAVPLAKYAFFNTRICRPVGLTATDAHAVVDFVISRLGNGYDVRNIVDLARYLLPTPPVPVRWRRRMLSLGSGEPTRVICSTLIAQAFQSIRYPILPRIECMQQTGQDSGVDEILHIRHHSLFVPRDFDLSPYFEVVKPTLAAGFDHRQLNWARPRQDVSDGDKASTGPKSAEVASPV